MQVAKMKTEQLENIKEEVEFIPKNKCLIKELHENIKDMVITKLLNQVESLNKELEECKKENLILKNDLTYILKRVLLHKNDFSNVSSITHQNTNIKASTSTSFYNKKSKSIFSSSEKFNDISGSSLIHPSKEYFNLNNSVEDDNTNNYSIPDTRTNNIDQKINSYLNRLYKHNCAKDSFLGSNGKYNLNKNQSFYEELFPSKSPSKTFVTPSNFKKLNVHKSKDRTTFNRTNRTPERGKSNSVRKFILCNNQKKINNKRTEEEKIIPKKTDNTIKYQPSKTINSKKDKPSITLNTPSNKVHKIKHNPTKSFDLNTNVKIKNQNKSKANIVKRSPFINNKV